MKENYNTLCDISNIITLVQLADNQDNTIHACDLSGVWIFDKTPKKSLPLTSEYLDVIFTSTDSVTVYLNLKQVFYVVWFTSPKTGVKILIT